MKYSLRVVIIALITLFISCQDGGEIEVDYGNPAADGFNLEGSDSLAIAVADEVMEAMGGRENWDKVRFLKWNFFGSRRHVWDRQTGDVLIEGIRDTFRSSLNLETLEGQVNWKGVELSKTDSLDKYLQRSKEMWINDSYWLLFPYKLKDSGVTLKYVKMDTTGKGEMAHVLELTFEEVGVTPENKYWAYIDTASNLLVQWDFYRNYTDTLPRFSTPWEDYAEYNGILLSSSRGENYLLGEISASDTLSSYFNN